MRHSSGDLHGGVQGLTAVLIVILFLKNLTFTLLVPGTVAGYLPWSFVRNVALTDSPWIFLAGIFFVAGMSVYLWCVYDFAVTGRGTPAPIDEPKFLVIRGLYQYVRNPMYVGVLMVLVGWSVLYRTQNLLIYSLVVATVFHLFVVIYEEPHLRRVFGDAYTAYQSKVGRWIPRRPQDASR